MGHWQKKREELRWNSVAKTGKCKLLLSPGEQKQ